MGGIAETDGCGDVSAWNKLADVTWPRSLFFFFVFFLTESGWFFFGELLIRGGVLLIPRSADEWKRGPDTHACEVSFHPLAGIQWGGQHQTNEGANWLPPGQRHALPSS